MKTTLIGVFLIAVGAASMIGGATGAPILIAMFGGMRGRATDTVLTRAQDIADELREALTQIEEILGDLLRAEA